MFLSSLFSKTPSTGSTTPTQTPTTGSKTPSQDTLGNAAIQAQLPKTSDTGSEGKGGGFFSGLLDKGGAIWDDIVEDGKGIAGQVGGLVEEGWNGGQVVPDAIEVLLQTDKNMTDLVLDHGVQPAIDLISSGVQKESSAVLGLFGASDETREGVATTIDQVTGGVQEGIDFTQDFAGEMVEPTSDLITKYGFQAINQLFLGGGPSGTGGLSSGKSGKLSGIGSVGDATWLADKVVDLTGALDQASLETFGGDAQAHEEVLDTIGSAKDTVVDLALTPGQELDALTRSMYPDLGNGGDKDAEAPGWLETGLGWLHTGLDYGTQGLTHGLGYLNTADAYLNQAAADTGQGIGNMFVNGMQWMGLGPTEEQQAANNLQEDQLQDLMLQGQLQGSTYLHNLADPLGDVVADAGLELGVGTVNSAVDWLQWGANLGWDLGQATDTSLNTTKVNRGYDGVSQETMDAKQQAADATQAQSNEWLDTLQNQLTNGMTAVTDKE